MSLKSSVLFRFPHDENRKKEWANEVPGKITIWSLVCSAHFKCDDFIYDLQRKKLRPHAVPSIFPEKNLSKTKSSINHKSQHNQVKVPLKVSSVYRDGAVQPSQQVNEENGAVQPSQQVNEENGAVQPSQQVNEENGAVQPSQQVNEENGAVQPSQQVNEETYDVTILEELKEEDIEDPVTVLSKMSPYDIEVEDITCKEFEEDLIEPTPFKKKKVEEIEMTPLQSQSPLISMASMGQPLTLPPCAAV